MKHHIRQRQFNWLWMLEITFQICDRWGIWTLPHSIFLLKCSAIFMQKSRGNSFVRSKAFAELTYPATTLHCIKFKCMYLFFVKKISTRTWIHYFQIPKIITFFISIKSIHNLQKTRLKITLELFCKWSSMLVTS